MKGIFFDPILPLFPVTTHLTINTPAANEAKEREGKSSRLSHIKVCAIKQTATFSSLSTAIKNKAKQRNMLCVDP